MTRALPVLLHVEDNPDDVRLLREALKEVGTQHRYLVAENAVQAYNHLRLMSAGFAPALVVVDLNLPLIKGHIVLREFRAHIPWSGTAMVVLTSSSIEAEHLEAMRAGAIECLVKPAVFEGYLGIARRLTRYLVTPPPTNLKRLEQRDLDRLARPDDKAQQTQAG